MRHSVLSVLVSNHFGVLTRVTNLFSRRGFNIKQLTVGETQDPEFSRITIVTEGDEDTLDQIYKQLSKLEDVKTVEILPFPGSIGQEMLLIKVRDAMQGQIWPIISEVSGRILDAGEGTIIIEVTGDMEHIDGFIRKITPFGILELCRTGVAALQTGENTIYGCSGQPKI